METMNLLYLMGLLLALFFILSGLDDFIWDLFAIFSWEKEEEFNLDMKALDSIPPKMIAVMLAAWNEENVLEDVIDHLMESQIYPQSVYHVFLGVYPNDEPTVRIAQKLASKYPNVHCVINYKEGPTSKAQNLNYVIKKIKDYEKEKSYRFASFTIHDSEDVVHPYELKVTNYLIEEHQALQFPVFPLIHKPKLKNYLKDLTTNTYTDEFAENHYITMRNRHRTGAFVPSAGTGFSLSREVVDLLGEEVLPENNLTEDYRLSLSLYEQGIQMYYVLERIKRVNRDGEISRDYIATRSIFPNTFKAAVKQKTRWMLGITMQSYHFKDLFKSNLSFVGRYSLYRDQKAKISNLLAGIGYPVVIYFIASFFTDLETIYPYLSLSWYLSLIVTMMMFERQIVRGYALYQVYGFRSTFFGVLFPPLLPFRVIWGNIINFTATFRAYIQYFKKSKTEKEAEENTGETIADEKSLLDNENKKQQLRKNKKEFRWSKTDHDFIDEKVLEQYRRKLGDILVEKGFLKVELLKKSLKNKSYTDRLGEFLIRQEWISEEELMKSLAVIEKKAYIEAETLPFYDNSKLIEKYERLNLEKNSLLPLYEREDLLVIAGSNRSPSDIEVQLREALDKDFYLALTDPDAIQKGLNQSVAPSLENKEIIESYSPEQIALIRNYAVRLGQSEKEIIKKMGLSV